MKVCEQYSCNKISTKINKNIFILVETCRPEVYQCIICSESFSSRQKRNVHIEQHFVHKKCEDCLKIVIVIGDLEFELHRPDHCANKCEKNDSVSTADEENVEPLVEVYTSVYKDNSESEIDQRDEDNDYQPIDISETSEVEMPIQSRPKTRASVKPRTRANNTANQIKGKMNANDDSSDNDTNEDYVVKEMDAAQQRQKKKPYVRIEPHIKCPEEGCEQLFRHDRTLMTHRKREHGFIQRHACHICGREFKDKGNMMQHTRTHGDHKRYICNYCGKGFHMPFNLKEHINQHTGARPYKCTVCGKDFNRLSLRNTHMRVRLLMKKIRCKKNYFIFPIFVERFIPAKNHTNAHTKDASVLMHIKLI